MSTASRVLKHLQERAPATGLPRAFYNDPAFFELDMELIHYREWLFVGHTAELPKTGSYLTLQVGAYPILVVRGADGAIRAFINSCRHRGARVCPNPHGTTPKLVCPYHQWTYELDGRLFAARNMSGEINRAELGLRPLHCESAAGYIFVCLAPRAPDFAATRAQLEAYGAPHRLADARVAFESTIIEEGNWKLVWENNRECYHCPANHPELTRTYPDTLAISLVGGDPTVKEHWDRCEAQGLPSRMQLSDSGNMRTVRMPLIGSALSYTMSGKPAVRRPLSDAIAQTERVGALLVFHYPTTWNHFLIDHAVTFRVLPLGPERTELTTKWLVHRDAVEGVDYDLADLTHVWLATNAEDQRLVHEIQIGMNAPAYAPGPLSSHHETGVVQFLDWYTSRLQAGLSEQKKLTEVA